MKKRMFKTIAAILLAGVFMTACKKDTKPTESNDEEIITTLKLNFTPISGGSTISYQFEDADGPGGENPILQDIVLAPTQTYNVSVELLNKTTNPVTDITEEVAAESDAHRFYYEPTTASNISVSGLNNDVNGIPLGITSTWTTTNAANGKIKVTLRHYAGTPPNKATDDPVNSSKSASDIEVEFNTIVQ